MSRVRAAAFLTILLVAEPATAAGQGPWRTGVGAGAILRLEPNRSAAGLDAAVLITRRQTPRVEVAAAAGVLWFPSTRLEFTGFGPDGSLYTEVQTEEILGPYLSLHAGRVIGRGSAGLLLTANFGVGLLRERFTASVEDAPPGVVPIRTRDHVDWELAPDLGVGGMLRLPRPASFPLQMQLDVRFRTLLFVGDGFVPTMSFVLGAVRR